MCLVCTQSDIGSNPVAGPCPGVTQAMIQDWAQGNGCEDAALLVDGFLNKVIASVAVLVPSTSHVGQQQVVPTSHDQGP